MTLPGARKRKLRLTAAPHATPLSLDVDGRVCRVVISRRQVIPVNSHVMRAYVGTPPKCA